MVKVIIFQLPPLPQPGILRPLCLLKFEKLYQTFFWSILNLPIALWKKFYWTYLFLTLSLPPKSIIYGFLLKNGFLFKKPKSHLWDELHLFPILNLACLSCYSSQSILWLEFVTRVSICSLVFLVLYNDVDMVLLNSLCKYLAHISEWLENKRNG